MQRREWTPWHITSSHSVCVLTWPQPSNRILPSRTQGNIRIAYAFGRSPHPHSSSMCSQVSSLPLSPSPSHFALTPKPWPTLLCTVKKCKTYFVSPGHRGKWNIQCATSWAKLSPPSSPQHASGMQFLSWHSFQLQCLQMLLLMSVKCSSVWISAL